MSLQVWLPLNGDLRNQGLTEISPTISGSGSTWSNTGKIGKCLNNNGTSYVSLGGNVTIGNTFTIAFWANMNSITPAWSRLFSFYKDESTYLGLCTHTNGYLGFHMNRSVDGTKKTIIDTYRWTNVQIGEWHHYAISLSGSTFNFYYDGELTQSGNGIGQAAYDVLTNIYTDNKLFSYGNNTSNCCLNDFRLYDHTLSPREIKEISKGLVLHMPLAPPGGENLILNSRNITSSNYALTRATADGEKITLTPTTSGSYLKYKATNVPYGEYKNKTYTVSFYARRISGNSEYTEKGVICQFGVNPTNRINNTLSASDDKYRNLLTINTITNEWGFYSFTATIPDDLTSGSDSAIIDTSMITFQLAVSGSGLPVEVIPIKFEIGDHPTPWTPNPADPEYAAMGFNDGIEYDVSGYGHNGIKYGDITPNTTTPRYNACSLLNSNTSYIVISGLNTTGFSNSYSISWWAKVTDYGGKMMWGFADGVRLNGIYYGNIWNTGDGSNNPIYQPGTTTQVSAPTGNTWHHFVMTGNGTKNYLYVDGILYGESKTYKTITGTTIYINGWSSATAYRYQSYFHISDFRIYATALSAEDILALYNTPESLTNTGALLTQGEFVEV